MANEIDLYQDLAQAEKMVKMAKENKDVLMLKAWEKECKHIGQEIKIKYPDLVLSNN